MDHFLRLPDSLFENILARLDDIPQLVSLRGLSRRWRQVILAPEFAALFNAQQHQIGYQWLVTLLFTEDRPNLGTLMCIEQSYARRRAAIPMNRVFQGHLGDLSLLSVDGSLVLFKYVANGITSLKVLNLFNMAVQEVHVPVLMEDDYDLNFNRVEHIRFQSLLDGGVITFYISTVVIGNWDLIPRNCLYISSQEDWAITDARPLEDDENLPEFNRAIGMMLLADDEAFKVSLHWGEAVFTRQQVLNLMDPFIHGQAEDFGNGWDIAGWDITTHLVPGRDGLVVQYQVVTNEYLLGLGRLNGIRFFRISPDWEAYERVASVPQHLIHGELLDYAHSVFIEETNGTINITFVAKYGDTGFCMLQYLYTDGDWDQRFTHLGNGVHAENPVFTSGLTIGHI